MLRRDYILRMIEEFIQVLARLRALRQGQHWQQADAEVDAEFQRLLAQGAADAARLSETELLARVIAGSPTQAVREKTLLVATLFKEAGDLAVAQERLDAGRVFYFKGLQLLLEVLARNEPFEWPDFIPRVEEFLLALQDAPLPLAIQAGLMHHYERLGEFAKAEDRLFAMLDAEPDNPALVALGTGFYDRLQHQTDASLEAGNLPRAELDAGRAALRAKRPTG